MKTTIKFLLCYFLFIFTSTIFLSTPTMAAQQVVTALSTRNSTFTSSDIVRTTENGIQIILNITSVPGLQSITPIIEGKDALGNYYPLLIGDSALVTGIYFFEISPGNAVIEGLFSSHFIPDVYRIRIVHSGAGSFTYSVALNTGVHYR